MGIPDPNLTNYLISNARDRAAQLLTSFVADHVADAGTDVVCARVGALFEDYCGGLLEGVKSGLTPVDSAEARCIRDHYVPLMIEFATALRDSIADSKTRHAAAQLIQCKVLEHERELRLLLEPPPSPVTTPELTSPKN